MDKESEFLMTDEELRERDLTDAQKQRIKKIEEDDFRWLMADKRGRRIMWRLLERTRVYQSSFTGNSQTFFLEGTRNVGLMLISDIQKHCAEQFVVMLKEHMSNER
ncbi:MULTISPECIES: endopeptidase [unclassified Limnobacter]|uniref:Bbp19 family protein n=1 Tax=unclassified Limnobacter TaxID=2630203 RepID=UPI0025BAD31B|nr:MULTISPECIES: endopeptidase [unclassified Limnobacter]|tara:strand:- start:8200 stop:8517 length:318 start_codon:yes stop_codon:yes gene_type:complete